MRFFLLQWTEKYKPKSPKDLIGNKSSYIKLIAWVRSFYTKIKSEKDFKPITLLIGPPGIGKTSGIIAIAQKYNYEILEFNASDQRNASAITRLVGRASKTKLNPGFSGRIVLLDEVDGIHGNEDRGGLAALLKLSKESVHPIICTANDPNSQKMRNLKNSKLVLSLSLKKPTNSDIIELLNRIVTNEGIKVSPKVLKVIANNSKGDFRGSVNDLENLAQDRPNKEIPIQAIQALSIRDTDVSIDLALSQIFGEAKTLRQAHEVTSDLDVDFSMFSSYVTENISQHAGNSTEFMKMYEKVALSNLFHTRIIFSQNWKFLKYCFYFLSAGVRGSKKTAYTKKYPKFPSLLIELSKSKKVRNLRASTSLKFGKLTHSSSNKTNFSTLPYIRLQFEELFRLFSKDLLATDKGLKIMESITEINNQIELEEDEFLYLFNDPLYEKPTDAIERKQKKLIKEIQKKTAELREQRVAEHNKNLQHTRKFSFIDDQKFQKKSPSDSLKNKSISANEIKEVSLGKNQEKITIKSDSSKEKAPNLKKKTVKKKKGSKSSSLFEYTIPKEKENKKKSKPKSKKLFDF